MKDDTLLKGSKAVPQHLQRLSRWMDSSIALPGGFRIGWDAIIGLVPGAGDLAGLGISFYIITGAYRAGASTATLLRMLLNVSVETVVGSVPVVGDLFDMAFKANLRNMRLLSSQLEDANATSVQSKRRLWLIVAIALMIISVALYATAKLLALVVGWLF